MSDEPELAEFLHAVDRSGTLQELKEVFPGDPRTRYDKRYSLARNWLQHYGKCGMVVVEKQAVPHGNFRYRFSLTRKGERFLDNG